jgi:hypothetical protein
MSFLSKLKRKGKNHALGAVDRSLGTLGMSNVIDSDNYSSKRVGEEGVGKYSDMIGGVQNQLGVAGLNMVAPGTGDAFQAASGMAGQATGGNSEAYMQGAAVGNTAAGITSSFNNPTQIAAMGGNVKPQYEAEGKEVVQGGNPQTFSGGTIQQQASDMFKIDGQSHNQGGVDMAGGERIFSDRLKIPGTKLSYAKKAEQLGKDKGKFEKQLDKKSNDKLTIETAGKNLETIESQIEGLFQTQEAAKAPQTSSSPEMMKYGGDLPKYDGLDGASGYLFGSGDVNMNTFGRNTPFAKANDLPEVPVYGDSGLTSMKKGNILGDRKSFDASKTMPMATKVYGQNAGTNVESGTVANISSGPRSGQGGVGESLNSAATAAPAMYNIFQGLAGKTEKQDPEKYYNEYQDEVMSRLDNRNFNIEPILQANKRTYNATESNLRDVTGGNAGAYLSNVGASQLRKQSGDAAAYSQKNNVENQYKGQAAQALGNFGNQRAGVRQSTDDFNYRSDAAKQQMLAKGLEQTSDLAQRKEAVNNMSQRDMMSMVASGMSSKDYDWDPKFLEAIQNNKVKDYKGSYYTSKK